MTTPALRLQLADARQLRAALADARQLRAALADARQLRAALAVAPLPEPGVGAVYVVTSRVPMITGSGTPPRYSPPNIATPWAVGGRTSAGGVVLGYAEVLPAEPARYVPGALRPITINGYTRDTIRVTDALDVSRDVFTWFHATLPDYAPRDQELEVAIGTDGVAALYSGGELALTASGGTGPYTWDILTNASGCTLTPEGAYVAGPLVGIDRVRVIDSLGEVGLAQLEVIPGQLAVDLTADQVDEPERFNTYGYQCIPYAKLTASGGTAPYSWEMADDETGAAIEPAKGLRAVVRLQDSAGAAVDLAGWTFDATLYSQRGGVMATGLTVTVAGDQVGVDLPDPSTLPLTPAVLRITAETAGMVFALGYPTTAIEVLLIAEES